MITKEHFKRFQGLLAKVHTTNETFKGKINLVKEEAVVFELDTGPREIKINDIDSAKLAQWPKSPR